MDWVYDFIKQENAFYVRIINFDMFKLVQKTNTQGENVCKMAVKKLKKMFHLNLIFVISLFACLQQLMFKPRN